MAAGDSRPVRSTPSPSRTMRICRVTSVTPVSGDTSGPEMSGPEMAGPKKSAMSSRTELVPQSIAATRFTSGSLQMQQHPMVAEGVGLDPFEVEELRDALVVGAQQLLVHLMGDRRAVD